MATFTSNNHGGRTLQLTISESVDVINNSSTLTWTLTSAGGSDNYYTISATTVMINGTTVYSKGTTDWTSHEFPAAKGSVSGTLSVAHNSDGTKTNVPVVFKTGVYNGSINDYGGTINLTSIDRTAPTISITLSNVTDNSVTVTASANHTIDLWEYSLDNWTTWQTLSTDKGSTLSKVVTGLENNKEYNFYVRGRRQYNQVKGISNAAYFKTYGASVLNSVSPIVADATRPMFTFGYTAYSSSYKHRVSIKVGSVTILTITDLAASKGTNTTTLNFNDEQQYALLQYMKFVKQMDVTVSLTTYKDGEKLGEASTKDTVVLTTEKISAPTFSDFTHYDKDLGGTVDITGNDQIYIQGESGLIITVEGASAKNYAVIKSYSVTIGSVTKTSTTNVVNFGQVNESGNVSVKVEVTDTRGYVTSMVKTIEVIPYEPISITDYAVRRVNEVEPNVTLRFSGDISPIKINGESRNRIESATLMYRIGDAGVWSNKVNIDVEVNDSTFSFDTSTLSDGGNALYFDPSNQYQILLDIIDLLNSDSVILTLNKGIPLLAYRSKKVGINEPNPQAALHISGEGDLLRLNEKTLDEYLLDKFYPIGSIYTSMSSVEPSELFGGEWERITDRFLWACSKTYPAGQLGGETEHLLTINEMPKHAHNAGVDGSQGITATKGGSTSAIVYFEAKNGTVSTSAAGNNYPHNNMPPYYAVYMWQRMK